MNTQELRTHWREWLMLLFGAWLVVSPFVLGFTAVANGMAMWSAVILGLIVAGFAVAEIMKPRMWEEGVSAVLGVCLIAAPFALGFADAPLALWNSVIMGVLVGGDAIWSLIDMRHHGGHAA
ncbi:SPW repeat protein [Halomonas organivorans]|uniref:SPW repeat-containing integral membrane domain-containing protein n=1 Tax=Halomonas organivorans TaxID=257772 RepID=A0A7W5G5E5_9GAMM|nr:SPW repeat protein [Halomonas organivorans]MBB3141049.1 hypothetical protein [Halomonas organivorans]